MGDTYILGSNAQVGVDTLQDVAAVVGKSLAVDVEKHSQQVARKTAEVSDVLLSSSLGDAALQNEVILFTLNGQDGLIGLLSLIHI